MRGVILVNIFLKYNANFSYCRLHLWKQQTTLIMSGNIKCLPFMRQVQQQDKELFLFVMPILGSVQAFPF